MCPGFGRSGDVKGGPAFTHISYNDFQIVDANLTQGKNLTIENRIVPYCVFTDPQLGGVGMTEKEARAAGHKLKIGKIPMSYVARAIERDETAGLMKIIVDAANDRILGAAILGCEGGELVHVLYTLMLGNLPYTLLKGAVYIHPTLTRRILRFAGQRETGGLTEMRKEQADAPLRIRRLRRSELPVGTIAARAVFLIGKTLVHDLPRSAPRRPHRRDRSVSGRRCGGARVWRPNAQQTLALSSARTRLCVFHLRLLLHDERLQ